MLWYSSSAPWALPTLNSRNGIQALVRHLHGADLVGRRADLAPVRSKFSWQHLGPPLANNCRPFLATAPRWGETAAAAEDGRSASDSGKTCASRAAAFPVTPGPKALRFTFVPKPGAVSAIAIGSQQYHEGSQPPDCPLRVDVRANQFGTYLIGGLRPPGRGRRGRAVLCVKATNTGRQWRQPSPQRINTIAVSKTTTLQCILEKRSGCGRRRRSSTRQLAFEGR